MSDFLLFLASIGTELYNLFVYIQRPSGQRDADEERRLAMTIIRKASDEQARREITGG